MIATQIGHSSTSAISIRGLDLANEVLGKFDFAEALALCATGRRPSAEERSMLNAILVVALDHGLTPGAIATRLTYMSAPESLAGAIAAGLLGAGSRFLGPATLAAQQFAEWTAALTDGDDADAYDRLAQRLAQPAPGAKLMGFGHPIHTEGDPRVPPLRELAKRNGFYGKDWRLADGLASLLAKRERPLPFNASGAIAVSILGMKLDPSLATSLVLVGRCGGLVAHLLEEMSSPIARQAWQLISAQEESGRHEGEQGAAS